MNSFLKERFLYLINQIISNDNKGTRDEKNIENMYKRKLSISKKVILPEFDCSWIEKEEDNLKLLSGVCLTEINELKRVRKKEFVEKIIGFLENEYWIPPLHFNFKKEVLDTLSTLYENFHWFNELVLIVILGISNTKGFTEMSQYGPIHSLKEKWCWRGIFKISGEQNYKKLAELTGDNKFVEHPEIMSTFFTDAIKASGLFWNDRLSERATGNPKFKLDLVGGLEVIFPDITKPGNEEEFKRIFYKTAVIYDKIRRLFVIN